MAKIVQLKNYDETSGDLIGEVFPLTKSDAVSFDDGKNLTEKLNDIQNTPTIWEGTQDQYDLLETKDNKILYLIHE